MPREQLRGDIKRKRLSYLIRRRIEKERSFVFLDESGVKTNMTRQYGWANRQDRCVAYVPHGHWKTSTIISAIRSNQVIDGATFMIDGPMTGECFVGYTKHHLAPNLKPGEIVVMDNLATHKCAGVREAIEDVGCDLWYLPPYSPDLNPIEKLWSKVKSCMRNSAARSHEQLLAALNAGLKTVSAEECRNYFKSCGYAK